MYETKDFGLLITRLQTLNIKHPSKDDHPELKKHLIQIAYEISATLMDTQTFLDGNDLEVDSAAPSEAAMAGHLLVNAGKRILALTEHAGIIEIGL